MATVIAMECTLIRLSQAIRADGGLETAKKIEGRGMMTLGSLFDGIGGWQLTAVHAGVKPIWSSE